MLDFLMVSRRTKKGVVEIYPKFVIKKSNDLMIRGGDFYAVWMEDRGLWSQDEQDALEMIDAAVKAKVEEVKATSKDPDTEIVGLYLWDAGSGMIDAWHKYCQKQMRDSYHMLDEKIIFSNDKAKKRDYASRRLDYPLEPGDISNYDKLMSTLYSPAERHKIEWAIGSIVSGDSKKLQKFVVLYGAAGTGKSTVLNIIQKLFDGYYSVFDARALGSSSNSFALEAFKSNPLVAIQHDGDLSRIEDNTRLNSLVSHETMTVNEKFKSTYSSSFKAFLFLGSNKPVKITDGKSGLIRRLIDVKPSGNKLPPKEYKQIIGRIDFELGAIASYCQDIYLADPGRYDDYIPTEMMSASNDFYNFVLEMYFTFKDADSVTLKQAWEMYKTFCEDAKVQYPMNQRVFKEELKNYFREYEERHTMPDGSRIRSFYAGFIMEKFDKSLVDDEPAKIQMIEFNSKKSIFDKECADCPAQYAGDDGKPLAKWDSVETKLSDIDTSKLHYVRVPKNHIVIDFDIPNADGSKSFEKNLEAASKWPTTYAELSKSGAGIHLHYIYTGDVSKLSRVYADHIEIKVFTGKSSLRRKLTKTNGESIAKISSGLPLKGDEKVINFEGFKSENALRSMIKKNLNKEIHPATKPSIDFIYKNLEDAYNSGLKYDVTDMRNAVLAFGANSTNQAEYCIKLVSKMKFKSDEASTNVANHDAKLIFYDIEVFPNLFLVNWKIEGEGKPVVRMINPSPAEIEELMKFRLVGFNCRRYDNHLLYARLMGYDNQKLYELSKKIIEEKTGFFGEAYNVSYTDVYDFCSKKQSLKKWEIELGIHHKELGLSWDEPVPEHLWQKVAEYCDNDVIATEAVFNARKADFIAREILADVAGMSVNDTTNSLTTRIIFGTNRKPQDQFNYRDMGDMSNAVDVVPFVYENFDSKGRPIFNGYTYEGGVSTYRGEEVGEGGYVYAEPGMYTDVALLDIASMHPSSIIAEQLFGAEFTKRFQDIRDARVAIKHKDFAAAKEMLGGKLAKYLDDESKAADLAQALKIGINSVYGLTAAKFDNPFRDIRNKDNLVAKRGALFMVNLKHAVQEKGFVVCHIKTDSIKIPNATPEIIQFVMDYGEKYGYVFEHEATYERMCLVNDAVYIAKYKDGKHAGEWTATGAQFAVPYVFKTLFSKEPIEFEDLCEAKSVATAMYLYFDEISGENSPGGYDAYRFIGKVGQFCPMKPGCGGGTLLRQGTDKDGNTTYSAVTGTKGYLWLESEEVKAREKERDFEGIDKSYYTNLVDAAVATIEQYGDVNWFCGN